jgi:signal transduction protein with GAF and PtsI domain
MAVKEIRTNKDFASFLTQFDAETRKEAMRVFYKYDKYATNEEMARKIARHIASHVANGTVYLADDSLAHAFVNR